MKSPQNSVFQCFLLTRVNFYTELAKDSYLNTLKIFFFFSQSCWAPHRSVILWELWVCSSFQNQGIFPLGSQVWLRCMFQINCSMMLKWWCWWLEKIIITTSSGVRICMCIRKTNMLNYLEQSDMKITSEWLLEHCNVNKPRPLHSGVESVCLKICTWIILL